MMSSDATIGEGVGFEQTDKIARIVLSRPASHNALSLEVLQALGRALDHVDADKRIRVVLLSAEGQRFFSPGADIKQWGQLSPDAMGRQMIREGNRVVQRIAALDAVVICVLAGDALGGGLELAMAADIRLAADHIKLSLPEVGIGAIPGWMGCVRLQTLIGAGRARQMILTGEAIDAPRAQAWGLLNEIMPRDALMPRAEALAATVAEKSAVALSVAKRLLNTWQNVERFAAMHELGATACLASPDAAEGVAAFREKRKARFD